MTEICLVRHGETNWNREFRLQGSQDIPLSEAGIAQAQRVADRLSKEVWDLLYSSDLIRAKHTAEQVNQLLMIPHYVENGLRERNYGPLEGMTRSEIDQQYPNILHQSGDVTIPGLESYEALCQRAKATLETIANRHSGKKILVISHGGTINAFLHSIIGERYGKIDNTSLTRLEFDGKKWVLLSANDSAHLRVENA